MKQINNNLASTSCVLDSHMIMHDKCAKTFLFTKVGI